MSNVSNLSKKSSHLRFSESYENVDANAVLNLCKRYLEFYTNVVIQIRPHPSGTLQTRIYGDILG